MKKTIIFFIILTVVSAITFFPSFSTGFIFNDYNVLHRLSENGFSFNYYSFMKNEQHVKDLRNKGLVPFYTHNEAKLNFFRPVSSVFIFFQFKIFKQNTVFYKIITFSLHLLCAILLFLLLKKITETSVAFIASALFIIGKTNLAVMNTVFSQDEVLSFAFTLAALLFFVNYNNSGKKRDIIQTILFCVLALLTKENGIFSIVFIIAIDLFVLKKGSINERLKQRIGIYCILTAITAAYIIFYITAGYGANSLEYVTPLTPLKYLKYFFPSLLLNFLSIFLYTPQRAFSANPLSDFTTLSLISIILLVVILIGLITVLRKNRIFHFSLYWLTVPLLLAVGYNPSEKMLYFSSAGYSIVFALISYEFIKKIKAGFLLTQIRAFTFFLLTIFIAVSPFYTFYVLGRYKYIGIMYEEEIAAIQKAMGGSYLSWRKLIIGLNHKYKYTLEGLHNALFVHLKLDYINFHLLNMNPLVKISRQDDYTLTLESYTRYGDVIFGSGAAHELPYLVNMDFVENQKFETEYYTVYILTLENGKPVKISVNTKLKLSDDGLSFLRYNVLGNYYEIKSFTREGLLR